MSQRRLTLAELADLLVELLDRDQCPDLPRESNPDSHHPSLAPAPTRGPKTCDQSACWGTRESPPQSKLSEHLSKINKTSSTRTRRNVA
jgi:hypothetical protein